MTSCDSIILNDSRITDTTINMLVPPITNPEIPVTADKIVGMTATTPRNRAPTLVILYNTCSRYCFVAIPGRIPGINPPCF